MQQSRFEVYDDIENDEADMIIAWVYQDGIKSSFLIGERSSTKISNPLLIPSLQETRRTSTVSENVERDLTSVETPPNYGNGNGNRWPNRVCTEQFQVNHRYDSNRYSEIWEYAVKIDPNGSDPSTAHKVAQHDGKFVDKWKIVKVHKNNIGQPISGHWRNEINSLAHASPYPDDPSNPNFFYTPNSIVHGVFYNIYERDWYASKKVLISDQNWAWDNGEGNILAKTRRKYSDQWYAFDPNSNFSNYYIPTHYLNSVSWAFFDYFHQDKGYILHWRVQ